MKKYLLLFLVLLSNKLVHAQVDTSDIFKMSELNLEDIMNIKVTTASKNSEGLQEAGAIISVVSSQEIQSFGALTLTDVLNRTTDLYMTGSYYFPNQFSGGQINH